MAVSASAESPTAMGVKRKPDLFEEPDEDHRQSLFIYNMTMSKLVTGTPTRHKPVEPSLQRSVLIRNTLRRLEASISMATPVHPPHSPKKKLQCVGWPVTITSTDSQTDFQLLLNGLVISSDESSPCPVPTMTVSSSTALAISETCNGAMEVECAASAIAEDDLASAFLAQGSSQLAGGVAGVQSVAQPLHLASHSLLGGAVDAKSVLPASAGDIAALAYLGDVDRVLAPRKDAALYGICSNNAIGEGAPRSSGESSFDEIDVSLLNELDAFCSAAAATRGVPVVEEFNGAGCSAARYDELDNILQVLVSM